jgi:ABC-type Fe3+/spermidine/putrescine transport system ATPase subunit
MTEGDDVAVRFNAVTKRFGDIVAVNDVSLAIRRGEFMTLLGPSGCGKTTLLNLVAGFFSPDAGEILIGGERVNDAPTYSREIGMMFQNYALFPHMSVFGNVAFGLSMRRTSKSETETKVRRALESVELWHTRDRKISQLSGGQQQRIALARAIAFDPDVILFDEPLSNLDANLREAMRLQLLELQHELGFAALYVTHDQAEAMSLSDRILVMNGGHVEQDASPQEVWNTPASSFVAQFVGSSNEYTGQVRSVTGGVAAIELDNGLQVVAGGCEASAGEPVDVFIRFNDVSVSAERTSAENNWEASVFLVSYEGHESVLKLKTDEGVDLVAVVPSAAGFAREDRVVVSAKADCVRTFGKGASHADRESDMGVPSVAATS